MRAAVFSSLCGPLFGFCPDRCLSSSSFPLFLAFAPAVLCPVSLLLLYVLFQFLLKIIYMLEMMEELKAQRHDPGLHWLTMAETCKVSRDHRPGALGQSGQDEGKNQESYGQ